MGDLLLLAKEGCVFSDDALDDAAVEPVTIPVGNHGNLATDPQMDGVFIAWGRRIKAGAQLPNVSILDVAPTIAALLDLDYPQSQGNVLVDLLQPDSATR
jgi:hypothetical protein